MLTHLYIQNYTLIDKLDISFEPGFSVITGETGAGKSIILGAIGLLSGQRADAKSLKAGASKCVVEAHFRITDSSLKAIFDEEGLDFDEDDTILRRELTANGKSRAFINDSPTQLSVMKKVGECLVDIHSQHQNLLLSQEHFQLNVVDTIADNGSLMQKYSKAYEDYRSIIRSLEQLQEKIASAQENEDFLRFQYKELSESQLQSGEKEMLEQEASMMEHAEDIKTALFKVSNLLWGEQNGGAVEAVRASKNSIDSLHEMLPSSSPLAERLESCYIEMKDIASEIDSTLENIDFDPVQLNKANERLDLLGTLEKKYKVESIEQLMELRDSIKLRLDNLDNSGMDIEEMKKRVEESRNTCIAMASQLTASRQKASSKIEKQLLAYLKQLGIEHAQMTIDIQPSELSSHGADSIQFLFSANKGMALKPISQVASGGEIARVMLSLKAIVSSDKQPTIIFDEIDTGVSGKIAEKMAIIMSEMGDKNRQVISITHLPQIAALGAQHYRVSKQETASGTVSNMERLSDEERVEEVAKMLSGADITQAAISNARELLNL